MPLVSLAHTQVHTHVNVTGHDGDVLEVQSSVYLVHEVERCGFIVVQGEHQSQGAQGLFSSGQVEDLFPALLWRTHTRERATNRKSELEHKEQDSCLVNSSRLSSRLLPEHDALRERIQTVNELQLGVAAQREHLVVLLQLVCDHVESCHELVEALFAQVLVATLELVPLCGDLVQLSHALQVQLLLKTHTMTHIVASQ